MILLGFITVYECKRQKSISLIQEVLPKSNEVVLVVFDEISFIKARGVFTYIMYMLILCTP